MMTARKAAPLLPENNDGSSYLYISLSDPTPESIHLVAAVRDARPLHVSKARDIFVASLLPSASKEPDTYRARTASATLRNAMNHDALALRCLHSTRCDLLQISDRAQ